MIRLFKRTRRALFFPVKWANAVSRWLLGVHSPEGTIKISNTANPKQDKSVGLDVDVDAVLSKIAPLLQKKGFSEEQRRDIRNIIRDSLDGATVKWVNNAVSAVQKQDDTTPQMGYSTPSGGLLLYANIHSDETEGDLYGTPVTLEIRNGIITNADFGDEVDLFYVFPDAT